MEVKLMMFIISAVAIIACVIFYNFVIYKKDKHIANLEDKIFHLRSENDALAKKYEETYECYMASLAREARRDGQ